jgi:peptidoglycan/xylan/chitin deacetylase (PgdA/CDA1 family)
MHPLVEPRDEPVLRQPFETQVFAVAVEIGQAGVGSASQPDPFIRTRGIYVHGDTGYLGMVSRGMAQRIPITMCHGIDADSTEKPLTPEHFDVLAREAAELGFESIDYDRLEAWRAGRADIPERAVMFDFDHPVKSMRHEIHDVLSRYGYTGTLFINTAPMKPDYAGPPYGECMTWDEIGELMEAGWKIGAHTVNHPNLSELSIEDPDGEKLRSELEECDNTIERRLGVRPRDFAFTGTSFSSMARDEVARRYRFGRLWITQAYYQVDGKKIRYADLVGVPGEDESDGGPPHAARYITRDMDPYLLPSMEIQALIYEPQAFRRYLKGAVE